MKKISRKFTIILIGRDYPTVISLYVVKIWTIRSKKTVRESLKSLRPILDEKLADPNYKIVFVLDSPSR